VPGDQADDEDNRLLDRWGDLEQPFGDPEESQLGIESPSVADKYGEPDTEKLASDFSDVDPDLLNTFVVCVVLTNLGILLVSVGILLAVFRGRLQIGGGLVVIGSLTLLRLRQYYRSYKRDREANAQTPSEPVDTDRPSDSEADESTVDAGSTDTDGPDERSGHNR